MKLLRIAVLLVIFVAGVYMYAQFGATWAERSQLAYVFGLPVFIGLGVLRELGH